MSIPQAVAFARHEHANEITAWGTPMIDHVLKVAEKVKGDDVTQTVAVLSKVLLTLDNEQHILKRFGPRVTNALQRLNPSPGVQQSYKQMVWQVKDDNHALAVLLADAEVVEAHYGDMQPAVRNHYMIQFTEMRRILAWEPAGAP